MKISQHESFDCTDYWIKRALDLESVRGQWSEIAKAPDDFGALDTEPSGNSFRPQVLMRPLSRVHLSFASQIQPPKILTLLSFQRSNI